MLGGSKAQYFYAIWQWDPCLSWQWIGQVGDFGASTSPDHKVQVGNLVITKHNLISACSDERHIRMFWMILRVVVIIVMQVVYHRCKQWDSVWPFCPSTKWIAHHIISQKINIIQIKTGGTLTIAGTNLFYMEIMVLNTVKFVRLEKVMKETHI